MILVNDSILVNDCRSDVSPVNNSDLILMSTHGTFLGGLKKIII